MTLIRYLHTIRPQLLNYLSFGLVMLLYMSHVNVMLDKEGARKIIHICVMLANSFDMIRSFFLNGYSSEKSYPALSSA